MLPGHRALHSIASPPVLCHAAICATLPGITTLGVATVLVAAGAWYASSSRAADNTAIPRDTPLLPGLQEAINDVASLAVTTADGTVTLERGEAGWTLAEKAGYPARADRVRTARAAASRVSRDGDRAAGIHPSRAGSRSSSALLPREL